VATERKNEPSDCPGVIDTTVAAEGGECSRTEQVLNPGSRAAGAPG